MRQCDYARNGAGLPIMKQCDIEDDSSMLIYRFDKSLLKSPKALDVEAYAAFMGAKLSSFELSADCNVLGFAALEKQAVNLVQGSVKLEAGEIVVNQAFLERGMQLYRYAVAHLSAHLFLHGIIEPLSNQMSFGFDETPSSRHFCCDLACIHSSRLSDEIGFEMQADDFALSLLMPKITFKTAVGAYFSQSDLNRNRLKNGELEFLCSKLSSDFGVPAYCVLIRLKKLNYIRSDL